MLMLKTATVLEVISKRRRTARPAAHAGLAKNTDRKSTRLNSSHAR